MQATVTEDRDKYVGGSDIPVIIGLSPFKTRYELLLEKAKLADFSFDGNKYTEYGNVMEPKIREYVSNVTGKQFSEDKVFKEEVRYHSDGASDDTILEIKTTSHFYENAREYKLYIVQLLTGMWAHDYEHGILAVYERPEDFDETFRENNLHLYDIEWDDYQDWWAEVCKAREAFAEDLAYIRENPFVASEGELPSASNLVAITNKILVLENRIVEMKAVEKEIESLKQSLKTAMEEHGLKSWDFGKAKVTLVADGEDKTVKEFDAKRFQEDFPITYEEYSVEKIKKGRKGYVKITVRNEQ